VRVRVCARARVCVCCRAVHSYCGPREGPQYASGVVPAAPEHLFVPPPIDGSPGMVCSVVSMRSHDGDEAAATLWHGAMHHSEEAAAAVAAEALVGQQVDWVCRRQGGFGVSQDYDRMVEFSPHFLDYGGRNGGLWPVPRTSNRMTTVYLQTAPLDRKAQTGKHVRTYAPAPASRAHQVLPGSATATLVKKRAELLQQTHYGAAMVSDGFRVSLCVRWSSMRVNNVCMQCAAASCVVEDSQREVVARDERTDVVCWKVRAIPLVSLRWAMPSSRFIWFHLLTSVSLVAAAADMARSR
jgi:hypothetical protein